jgi:hypothetical protein
MPGFLGVPPFQFPRIEKEGHYSDPLMLVPPAAAGW